MHRLLRLRLLSNRSQRRLLLIDEAEGAFLFALFAKQRGRGGGMNSPRTASAGPSYRGIVESMRAPPSRQVPPDCTGTQTFTSPVHDAPAGSVASKKRW